MRKSILLIDDDPLTLGALAQFFARRGWTVSRALEGRTGIELYERDTPALVITDLEMPGLSGLQVVDVLRSRDPEATVLVLTGTHDVSIAVEALRLGAEDFLTKPVDWEHLEVATGRALERASLRRRAVLEAPRDATPDLLGHAPALRELGRQLTIMAGAAAPVLVAGETGTGKGWVARRLHALSPRAAAPFLEVNCAGLTAATLDAELFGVDRAGDGRQLRRGSFELAQGGTLLLDEVGDLAPELQPKLLGVLESQRFRRVGGTREVQADVRIVAATHVDLHEAVRQGRFREDLYYRLAVLGLTLPPLRERGAQEVARLAHLLLDVLRRQVARAPARLSPEALLALARYGWPGNVRELRNVLERAALLAAGAGAVLPAHLPPEIEGRADGPGAAAQGPAPPADGDLSLRAVERAHILRVLALSNHNKAHAARALGITRATLYAKLREIGA